MSPRLEVDLAAFDHNLAVIRRTIGSAEFMLVVKDDAYGHGIPALLPRAVTAGVRWVGAFDVPTARAVRRAVGSATRIFVWMLSSPDDVAEAIDLDLDLGIGDPELLEDVADRARTALSPVRVHLKIDTGLHRNGFRPEGWDAAVRRARDLEREGLMQIVGVWSHIAEASRQDDDDARAAFERGLENARDLGVVPALRHLSASSASFARPDFRYDLVRIGAFAYGIAPTDGPTATALGLRPIARLVTRVVDVDEDIARIAIGSLDGLLSTLGGRIEVGTAHGPRRLLFVGSSESGIDGAGLVIGDEVVVYGPGTCGEHTATALAQSIGTIGEEIAVRISPRVERTYSPATGERAS